MIKYSIRGENLEVTEAIRDYVVSKLEKIEKYFQADQELDARVNLKVYREKTAKVEVTIPLGSITLRAEDVSQDMYGSKWNRYFYLTSLFTVHFQIYTCI